MWRGRDDSLKAVGEHAGVGWSEGVGLARLGKVRMGGSREVARGFNVGLEMHC
jgi:hypothetical protein